MTRAALPNARIIVQQDANVLAQLIRTSDVLGFVTEASAPTHPDEERVRVPIQDSEAHATFYVVAMVDAPQAVLDIVEAAKAWRFGESSSCARYAYRLCPPRLSEKPDDGVRRCGR